MELRWLYFSGTPAGQTGLHLGEGPQTFTLVLQYREGVTHDHPWLDVPMAFYQPPECKPTGGATNG